MTGYEGTVKETARITNQKVELTEEQQAILDERLRLLEDALPNQPEAVFTYFQPDSRKEGGSYVTVTGALKKLDRLEHRVILTDGTAIPIDDLLDVDSHLCTPSDKNPSARPAIPYGRPTNGRRLYKNALLIPQ